MLPSPTTAFHTPMIHMRAGNHSFSVPMFQASTNPAELISTQSKFTFNFQHVLQTEDPSVDSQMMFSSASRTRRLFKHKNL